MRKDKKQMILQLLNEKIMPSYADKLAYFPSVGLPIPNSRRVLSQLWEGLPQLSQLYEGSIPTLGEFYPNSGGVYPNSGRVYHNSGSRRVLSQLWQGFIPTLSQLWGGFYPNSGRVFITTLGGFYPNSGKALSQLYPNSGRVLSQLSEGSIPTLGRFYPNSIPTLGGFYHNSAEFFPTPGVFLKHRDAICGAQGRDFLSMGLLIFEHRDAIF